MSKKIENKEWCPKCNTIKDITKNKPRLKKDIDAETTEDNIKIYIDLIDNILANKKISSNDMQNIKLEVLTKTKKYKSLKKENKDIVHEKVSGMVKEIDDTVTAYFVCTSCGWSQEIPKETKILSKGHGSVNKNTDLDRYKNMSYCSYLGNTRGYICINDKCKSHKDHEKREAVYFRDTVNSTRTIMVCRECQAVWIAV